MSEDDEDLYTEKLDEATGEYYRVCAMCDEYKEEMDKTNAKLQGRISVSDEEEQTLREHLKLVAMALLNHQRLHSDS